MQQVIFTWNEKQAWEFMGTGEADKLQRRAVIFTKIIIHHTRFSFALLVHVFSEN